MQKKALTVVYALATNDYQWLKTFYPVKRMQEAADTLEIPIDFILEQDFIVQNTVEKNAALTGAKVKDSFFLLRGTMSSAVYDILEHWGATHCPTRKAAHGAQNKAALYAFLQKEGYPIPTTCVASIGQAEYAAISQKLGSSIIVKPVYGSMGRDICLLEGNKQFELWLKQQKAAETLQNTEWIFQTFIKTTRQKMGSRDIRFFVCKEKILSSVERHNDKSFLSNVHQGGKTSQVQLSKKHADMSRMAIEIIKKAGLLYGTVDFLPGLDGDFFVCEINASPGFEGIEVQTSIKIAEPLLASLC